MSLAWNIHRDALGCRSQFSDMVAWQELMQMTTLMPAFGVASPMKAASYKVMNRVHIRLPPQGRAYATDRQP